MKRIEALTVNRCGEATATALPSVVGDEGSEKVLKVLRIRGDSRADEGRGCPRADGGPGARVKLRGCFP
ncbi:hypothetical protein SCA03_63010 [Streptomyces cacaoi]|uniref:Uncharacterized protein n=1 Tax=Streptomyces cacaoi TaxID=1898 RepID=A0A4Y3RDD0_STRCI|nr:hypothetical protein SCA03_63010 [Streptomyces cacaoi]